MPAAPASAWPRASRSSPARRPPAQRNDPQPSLTLCSRRARLHLSLVPGGQALNRAGRVLPAQPSQRRQHDDAKSHPLIEAAASHHVTQQAEPDQPHRPLLVRSRGRCPPGRAAAAGQSRGCRRPAGVMSGYCHFAPLCPGAGMSMVDPTSKPVQLCRTQAGTDRPHPGGIRSRFARPSGARRRPRARPAPNGRVHPNAARPSDTWDQRVRLTRSPHSETVPA
jgi:hypothetical protein